ncbi:hypothetical protein HDU96_010302 [Phlyctochytrium bullatum]|nr:hypothetical protein HDU96_010302 [Phlyctochytrium bullatum]
MDRAAWAKILSSRATKDVLKGTIAYVLAFVWIFVPATASFFQGRTYSYVVLVAAAQNPYRQKLVSNIAQHSYLFSGLLCAFAVYLYSAARAINPIRFYGFALLGPVITLNGLTSALGANGPKTPGAWAGVDQYYLVEVLGQTLVGLSICWVVNVFIWPDFAETKLNKELAAAIKSIGEVLSAICDGYMHSWPEDHFQREQAREKILNKITTLVDSLQAQLAESAKILNDADAEVYVSHLAISDYTDLHECLESLCNELQALASSFSNACLDFLGTDQIRSTFREPLLPVIRNVRNGCLRLLSEIRMDVLRAMDVDQHFPHTRHHHHHGARQSLWRFSQWFTPEDREALREEDLRKMLESHAAIFSTLHEFEDKQVEVLVSLFELKYTPACGFAEDKLLDGNHGEHARWNAMLQVNFFILGIHQATTSYYANRDNPSFDPPAIRLYRNITSAFAGLTSAVFFTLLIYPNLARRSLRAIIASTFKHLNQYYTEIVLSAASLRHRTPFLISSPSTESPDPPPPPSRGEDSQKTLDCMKEHPLTQVEEDPSLSTSPCDAVIVAPSHASSTISTRAAPPRHSACIFRETPKIPTGPNPSTVSHASDLDDAGPPIPDAELRLLTRLHANISAHLAAAEPLMVFAQVEPRLDGAFPAKSYRSVLEGLRRVLNRLGNMRVAVGKRAFSPEMLAFLRQRGVAEARRELHETIRILLYIFSSAFVSKQPLPVDLPCATRSRQRLVDALLGLVNEQDASRLRSESWIRFYSYILALKGVSIEVDALAGVIKDIFGQMEQITVVIGPDGDEARMAVQPPPPTPSQPPARGESLTSRQSGTPSDGKSDGIVRSATWGGWKDDRRERISLQPNRITGEAGGGDLSAYMVSVDQSSTPPDPVGRTTLTYPRQGRSRANAAEPTGDGIRAAYLKEQVELGMELASTMGRRL